MEDEFRFPLERRLTTLREHRDELQDQLRELHHQLNSVDRRIEAAEELYRREFGTEPPDSASIPDGRRATRIRRTETDQPSWRDAVVGVLGSAETPLHARDIWQRLRDSGFKSGAVDPVRSVVAIAIRTDQIRRTAPNTFALDGVDHDERQLRVGAGADTPVPAHEGEENG